jgi:hypothetical protein
MRLAALLSLVFLVACDSPSAAPDGSAGKPGGSAKAAGSAPGSGKAASSAAEAPKLCDKADKLQKRLADVDTKAQRVGLGADIALPESKDGAPISSMWPAVVVTTKDIRVNGQAAKPAELKDKLNGQNKVLLAIPKGEEGIGRVSEVVTALGPDVEVYLVASVPGSKMEPPPKGMDLKGKDQGERAMLFAQALTKSIADCAEAKKLFSQLASDEPSGRAESVKKGMPVAINACSCKVADDTEDLIAFLLAGDPPLVGKKLSLSKEKDTKAIALKGLDGQKLYDALPADGSPVKLEK